ncbi:MAG: type II toxin-antitoxin system PemK/MazF family toxin [Candidatus Omnitrophica bacterium]|nr:type II toxin-antitoxin system PemK/MazF family toxin [Candidatus Omnitrophota bacterium]MBU0896960.1 type II toxin-antitoxin system PemK/MazF family toxin [Candidatus Omnitrophota bacterium]
MEKKSNPIALKRGDIILIPFPFTDLTSSKVRPAVIISSNPQKNDIIIAFISSIVSKPIGNADFLLTSSHPEFSPTGLKRDSIFKMDKLLTIHNALILRYLGRVNFEIQKELDELLKKALGLA